jgi:hypothetical protein
VKQLPPVGDANRQARNRRRSNETISNRRQQGLRHRSANFENRDGWSRLRFHKAQIEERELVLCSIYVVALGALADSQTAWKLLKMELPLSNLDNLQQVISNHNPTPPSMIQIILDQPPILVTLVILVALVSLGASTFFNCDPVRKRRMIVERRAAMRGTVDRRRTINLR